MPDIHPTAIVDQKAELAEDVRVGPFTIIEGDVVIESGTVIDAHALIADGARIGKGAVVGAGSVVTDDIPDGGIAVGIPARVVKMRNDLSKKNEIFHQRG